MERAKHLKAERKAGMMVRDNEKNYAE